LQELQFWEIPDDLISECCWENFNSSIRNTDTIDHIEQDMADPYGMTTRFKDLSMKLKIWYLLENRGTPWKKLEMVCINSNKTIGKGTVVCLKSEV
jgi:hypothetical protein